MIDYRIHSPLKPYNNPLFITSRKFFQMIRKDCQKDPFNEGAYETIRCISVKRFPSHDSSMSWQRILLLYSHTTPFIFCDDYTLRIYPVFEKALILKTNE